MSPLRVPIITPAVGVSPIVVSIVPHPRKIVETFQKVVAPFPPGSEITLADGRRGVVTTVPLGQLDLPTVRVLWDASGERIDRHEVDLRAEPLLAPVVSPIRRVA